MCSTPNTYPCNTLKQIDRDIRRVEDNAAANTAAIAANYKEQGKRISQSSERITRNEANIACLGKRLEDANGCSSDTYCKETVDCKLAAKADKCEFEKHLINPHAHEELFDRKVDKQDGCRLICEEELQGIYDALDDRYPKGKVYTQAEVNELLKDKAGRTPPFVHDLPLAENVEKHIACTYYKNDANEVVVQISVKATQGHYLETEQVIATLPDGFRPPQRIPILCLPLNENTRNTAPGVLVVQTNGDIVLQHVDKEITNVYGGPLIFIAQ